MRKVVSIKEVNETPSNPRFNGVYLVLAFSTNK